MKIRLLTAIGGDRFNHGIGEVIERDDEEAKRMIEKGHAEPVRTEDIETATAPQTRETTARRR